MTRRGGANPDAARAFYDKVGERQNNWGSHGLPRASSIGNDLRQQYFNIRRDIYPPLPISGESLWGMAAGNWQEEQVYQALREQGYQIHGVQAGAVRYVDADTGEHRAYQAGDDFMGTSIDYLKKQGHRPFMTCHIDGILEGGPDELPPTLLELKMATMFSFGGMVQNGVAADKPGYRMQAAVGSSSFGLDMTRFYVFTRDKSATEWYFTKMRSKNPILANPALYVEDLPTDDRWVKMADARALFLLDAVEAGSLPDPDAGISPLNTKIERDGEQHHIFPCSHCEWREPCIDNLRQQGVNVNEFVVVEDHRSKKEKELG